MLKNEMTVIDYSYRFLSLWDWWIPDIEICQN